MVGEQAGEQRDDRRFDQGRGSGPSGVDRSGEVAPSRARLGDSRYERGWLVGLITGCARGVVRGRRRALRLVLEARFGRLSPEHAQRVGQGCPAALEAWISRAAVVDDPAQVWAIEATASRPSGVA